METFIGQISMFGGNFAPRGWAFCDGQLLSIASNTALFSLLGTTYGGDGRTTFALPDLRGRVPMHHGQGPGLSPNNLGQRGGRESLTLVANNIPPLVATIKASTGGRGGSTSPVNNYISEGGSYNPSTDTTMAADAATFSPSGSQTPISTRPPFQVINYIIALQGVFPSRS